MADTRSSPLAALARGLEIGAVASAWMDRHPRWLERLGASVEIAPGDLKRLIIILVTARQLLPRQVFEWAATRESWILIEGNENAEALSEIFEPWWRALSSPLHHWRVAPAAELGSPEAQARAIGWLGGLVDLLGRVRIKPPADLELSRVVSPLSWPVAGLALVGEGLAAGKIALDSLDRIGVGWEALRTSALVPLERFGFLPTRPLESRGVPELFPSAPSATPMQELAASLVLGAGPQLFLMEEAPGAGKTEAAVLLAHRLVNAGCAETIFLTWPWTAVTRAVQQRVVDVQGQLFASEGRASLLPGRWNRRDMLADTLGDSSDPARAFLDGFLADPRKRPMWSPVGGDTLEQLLLAVLPSRFAGLRLLALSRSVLVIDQVQPCDGQALRYLVPLLELHANAGGSAIVLSTAIPRDVRARLMAPFLRGTTARRHIDRGLYPRLTHASSMGVTEHVVDQADPERSGLSFELIEQESSALNHAIDAVSGGKAVLWVRNSVEAAIVVFAHAVKELGHDAVVLSHERFTMGDRLDIERVLTSRFGRDSSGTDRAGWLVIATSSIESRDLDFDMVISDLAPIDVLLDRAGRLHRHRRTLKGDRTLRTDQRGPRVMMVVTPPWTETPSPTWLSDRLPESSRAYPEHGTLWLTLRALRTLRDTLFPEDAHQLLERVYGEDAIEAIPHTLWQSKERLGMDHRSELDELRNVALLPMPPHPAASVVREGWTAPTRLGPDATTLRLARVVSGVVMPLYASPSGGWELSELTVPSKWIARRVTAGLEAEIATAEKLMPDRGRYCATVVLNWDPVHEQWWGVAVSGPGAAVELVYRNDVGLVGR